ncbi:MAG: hypothetical protein NZ519_07745 [Bacteroidia bacterium]|nr:hypothetical protein [Bacteroidia bacterium]
MIFIFIYLQDKVLDKDSADLQRSLREACGGRAIARCEAPRPYFNLLPKGGWGAAPLARSTPTRAQRGTRPK